MLEGPGRSPRRTHGHRTLPRHRGKVRGTEEHPAVAASLHSLAVVCEADNRLEEAAALYRRTLAIDHKCFGSAEHYTSAETEFSLAMLLFRLGQQDEARALLDHALRVLHEQVPNHPILQHLRVRANV
ncbi:MAG: tetratricopeptide repeat protein [Polyangiaceae bacterium]